MKKDYPSKLYYSISEVAGITGVKPHVLRYWETEFPTLKPKKTRSGSRRYRQNDIQEILAIKDLLYVEGFKIAGARKMRRQAHGQARKPRTGKPAQLALGFDAMDDKAKLEYLKEELEKLLAMVRDLQLVREKQPGKAPAKEMEGEA